MKIDIEKLPAKTFKLSINVPKEKVNEVRNHVIEEMVKEVEVNGFRKGNAPRDLAENKLDKKRVGEEVLNHTITEAYNQAVKEHLLKPIAQPEVSLSNYKEGEDLSFTATCVERPEINLGDYKAALVQLNGEKKSVQSNPLLGPDGKPIEKKDGDAEKITIQDVLKVIVTAAKIEISDLLINEEVNRMLSRLVDQTAKIGITIEEYLNSQSKTADSLRVEYRKIAEESLKTEFILYEIAKTERVEVLDAEIDRMIEAAPDDKTRAELNSPDGRIYVRSILLKNKTIQKLIEVAEAGLKS